MVNHSQQSLMLRQAAANESGVKPPHSTHHWPHAPCHIFDTVGTYMVTASTLHKKMLFQSPRELNLLQNTLFELSLKYEWRLEAWAIFPNHYHIIAHSPLDPTTLKKFISHLHTSTAKDLNQLHNQPGRKIWHQFWDTRLSFEKSYFARLNYVMQNPVRHGLVTNAENYPWCSVRWFKENSIPSRQATVESFKTDLVHVIDDFY